MKFKTRILKRHVHCNIKLSLILLVTSLMSGCFGDNSIAEGRVIQPTIEGKPLQGTAFKGKVYMLNAQELESSVQVNDDLKHVYNVAKAVDDSDFERALTILDTVHFSERSDDQLVEKILLLRQIISEAEPKWQQLLDEKISKLENDLLTHQTAHNKNTKLLNDYNAFFKKEYDEVKRIEEQIAENKVQMAIITKQAMDYMNKVIVDEELPLKKVKLSGPGVADNMKYIFSYTRGFGYEGTARFKKAQEYVAKNTYKYQIIDSINGKQYSHHLRNIAYKEIIQNDEHFKNLFKLYVDYVDLAWMSTPGESGKPQGDLLKELTVAKKAQTDRSLIARNKFDIPSAADLIRSVGRGENMIERISAQLESPENPAQKAAFLKQLTASARKDLAQPLKDLLPQVVDSFFASINNVEEIGFNDSFNVPEHTVALSISGKASKPNFFTGEAVKMDVSQSMLMSQYSFDESKLMPISFGRFKRTTDYEKLTGLVSLSTKS